MKARLLAILLCAPVAASAAPQLWSEWVLPTITKGHPEMRPHERTRPLIVGDILYLANLEGRLLALHRKDGYVLWEKQLEGGVEGALTYGRSKLFVGTRNGTLLALNARDGSESWRFSIGAEWLSAPAVARDRLYVMSSSDELLCLGSEDGKILWRYSHRGDEKMTIRGTSGPALADNDVYAGFSDGSLAALSADSGQELWTKKLRTRERFYDVDMTPTVDETAVYAAAFDGNLYRLDRKTGQQKWQFPVGSYGGLLLDEGKLYFSGLNGSFYALDVNSGQSVWKVPFEAGVGLAPTKVGDALVVTTSADPFYVLDPKDGKLLWAGRLGVGTMTPAASAGDEWFYCLSNYGNLYAYSIWTRPFVQSERTTLGLPSAISRENWL